MNVREFLHELAFSFPTGKKPEDLDRFLETYVDEILGEESKHKGYELDYLKLLSHIRRNYAYKKFPNIAEIIIFLPKGLVPKASEYTPTQYEGQKLFLFLKSGEIREYSLCNFGKPFSEIRDKLAGYDNILKALVYPPDVCLIGNKLSDTDDNEETIPGKVLYEAGSF